MNDVSIKNQAAQAAYYERQTHRGVIDPALLAALAALFASLLALVVNTRIATRSARDTQFYEALKRLTDMASAASRTSAAVLLAQLARPRRIGRISIRSPYLTATISQLAASLLLETDLVVINAIIRSSMTLAKWEARAMLEPFWYCNLALQDQMVSAMMRYCASRGATDESGFAALIDELEKASPFDRITLWTLLSRFGALNAYLIELHRSTVRANKDVVGEDSDAASAPLATQRLRAGVTIFADILRQASPLHKGTIFLGKVFLAGANLTSLVLKDVVVTDAQLEFANLTKASLNHVTFVNCSLRDSMFYDARLSSCYFWKETLLTGARFERTDFQHTRWGTVDFTRYDDANWRVLYNPDSVTPSLEKAEAYFRDGKAKIDEFLLDTLWTRADGQQWEKPLSIHPRHPSVTAYMDAERKLDRDHSVDPVSQ